MEATKLFCAVLLLFVASAFTACDNDDELKENQIGNTASRMKGSYFGELKTSGEGMQECTLVGIPATFDDTTLHIRIPLELVAEQIRQFNPAYNVLSNYGYANVNIIYDSIQTEHESMLYSLHPLNVVLPLPTDTLREPIKPSTGIHLTFSDSCSGNYQNGQIIFDLCINGLAIDDYVVEGFKPVRYHYEGTADISNLDGHHILEMAQMLKGQWNAEYRSSHDDRGVGMSQYFQTSSLVYTFNNGLYTIKEIDFQGKVTEETGKYTIDWGTWGNEHHRLHLIKPDDIFPYVSHNIDLTNLSLSLTGTESGWRYAIQFRKATTN